MNKSDIQQNEEAFRYLFDLQRSGQTNMFGAAPYLQSELGLNRDVAKTLLIQWMENYDEIAKELEVEV